MIHGLVTYKIKAIIINKNKIGPTGWNLNALLISSVKMHKKHLVMPHKGHGMPNIEAKKHPHPNWNILTKSINDNNNVIMQKSL